MNTVVLIGFSIWLISTIALVWLVSAMSKDLLKNLSAEQSKDLLRTRRQRNLDME